MGTHSTVKFYRKNRCLLALYNQYDGYYEGVGQEIADFFNNKDNYGNGFDDTALLYVCYKKQGKAYNTYLTTESNLEEYNYEIIDTDDKGLRFTIIREHYNDNGNKYFEIVLDWATLDEFTEFIKNGGNAEGDE